MSKFQSLLMDNRFIIAYQFICSAAIAVGLLFYQRALLADRSAVAVAFIDIAFIVACGSLFVGCFLLKKPDFDLKYLLIWTAVGYGGFSAVFFTLTGILNAVAGDREAFIGAVVLVASFSVACIVTQDVFCFPRGRKPFLVFIAAVSLLAYGLTVFYSYALSSKGWLFKAVSRDKIQFKNASYEEVTLTDDDRNTNKEWFDNNIINAVKNGNRPAYDFSLGGKKLSDNLSEWTSEAGESYAYKDGVATDVTLTNEKEKVQAVVKAVYYQATATFEWTVYIKNVGEEDSAAISSFYPLDSTIGCEDPTLYFSGGSDFKNTDFALYSRKLSRVTYTFDTQNGRTSQTYLPFFNVNGANIGFTVGIGWTGEWKADFTYADQQLTLTVGQKVLEGYLEPGEEIRSPLVSVSLYHGNVMKGFNTFRKRVLDSLPDNYGNMKTFAFAGAEGEANMAFVGEEGTKKLIDIFEKENLLDTVDYAWYDAGWFDVEGLGQWNSTSGDWEVDPKRYPNGLKAVSDYLHEKGIGMLLWYEPERIPDRSKIYQVGKEREKWLLSPCDLSSSRFNNYIWNMGDKEALEYMIDHVFSSIKANGVDFYRQDFNVDPGAYWEKADEEIYDGRKGFCENKYVVGEYAYLDALVSRAKEEMGIDLLIDNCASGGRRIDLEMCRRSVPLWRSDYNCFDYPDLEEACQYQTYGLSLWLPLSNCGNDWTTGEYDYRSFLGPIIECYPSFLNGDTAGYRKFVAEYEQIKGYFLENYYPLTTCTMSERQTVAMQFGNEKEGIVLVFARGKTDDGEKTFRMSGLKEGARYDIKTIEGEDVAAKSGEELLTDGLNMETKKRTAYILVYKEV